MGVLAYSPPNGNHFAIGLVIISKVVFAGLSIDNAEKELLELFISCAGPQRFHDVELQIAAKTWTQFSITGKAKLITAVAEMQVRHRTDETDALRASGK